MDGDDQVAQLRAVAAAVGLAGAGLGAAFVVTLAAALVVGALGVQLGVVVSVVLTLALTAGVAFGGVSVAYLAYRGRGPSTVGLRWLSVPDLAWTGGGYLLALGAALVVSLAVVAAGGEPAPNQLSQLGVEAPALLLLLVPVSLLFIGPGEELLFRGVVQGRLREAFGPAAAVLLSSAIFAGSHFLALVGSAGARLTTIAVLFFPALVLGAAYERTGNLVVPALIHGLYNATLAVLLYVALQFSGMGATAALTPW
ncbi:MAG: lysostaphin resistance A-like protein [Halobacteriales archaeon]